MRQGDGKAWTELSGCDAPAGSSQRVQLRTRGSKDHGARDGQILVPDTCASCWLACGIRDLRCLLVHTLSPIFLDVDILWIARFRQRSLFFFVFVIEFTEGEKADVSGLGRRLYVALSKASLILLLSSLVRGRHTYRALPCLSLIHI